MKNKGEIEIPIDIEGTILRPTKVWKAISYYCENDIFKSSDILIYIQNLFMRFKTKN